MNVSSVDFATATSFLDSSTILLVEQRKTMYPRLGPDARGTIITLFIAVGTLATPVSQRLVDHRTTMWLLVDRDDPPLRISGML